jgi:trafficking protein particle complex subunit 3
MSSTAATGTAVSASGTSTTATTTPTSTTTMTTTVLVPANHKNTTIQGNLFWSKQPKANAELFALTYGSLVNELVRDMEDSTKINDELDKMGHSIGIRCIEEVLAKSSSYEYNNPNNALGSTSTQEVNTGNNNPGSSSSSSSSISRNYQNFYESAEIIKIAFRMFLGLIVECTTTNPIGVDMQQQQVPQPQSYSIKFLENPLTIFVELPEEYRGGNSNSNAVVSSSSTESNNTSTNTRLEYSQLLAGMVRGMLEMLQYDCTCTIINSVLNGNDLNEIYVELKQILQDGAGDEYHEE